MLLTIQLKLTLTATVIRNIALAGHFRSRPRQGQPLLACQRDESYKPELKDSPVELLFSHLGEFSDAHPKWQREYS
jgi:hypothetical protein